MAAQGESYFAAYPPKPKPFISHGLTFEKACAHHAETTFHASRIYVVVSRTISKTEAFTALQKALGDKIVGVRYGILPHTPWEDVFALADDLNAKNPDLIITLGAGSISDGVKLARLLAANGVSEMQGADELFNKCFADLSDLTKAPAGVKPATIPVINVPTSLSGGEFTSAGAATNLKTFEKRNLWHESMIADIIVFDPALTVSTPERFWLSTGVRGVDHCTEGLYATQPGATPELLAEMVKALRMLLVGLLKTKQKWDDLDARLQTQLALKTATRALECGMGASHGIGHQLGPMGVGHGETSCIMLPFVMKYNWTHGDEKVRDSLRQVASAFWDEPAVVEALGLKEADRDTKDPGDLVAAFVSTLGLPRGLSQFGIGNDKFEVLAENSLLDPCIKVNPVKLDKEKVIEILKMAA
ncbi:Dehydroquinate synthase-like protein [Hypoxylon trugodes]|uniref:Dehydroquinate synthase-like protein n=1 Tax=Hypoxylon trugodes TaxID=326681 RepID=UPI002194B849|nr:Dehydroquinate synthase-like protein [Hypoxylon trugodes]KAI1387546.1 Dehydroquinate synthase-like protein [Hypoxylon trugodes]